MVVEAEGDENLARVPVCESADCFSRAEVLHVVDGDASELFGEAGAAFSQDLHARFRDGRDPDVDVLDVVTVCGRLEELHRVSTSIERARDSRVDPWACP